MRRLTGALGLLLWLCSLAPAHAAGSTLVPMRDWLRDVEKLETQVLQPLTQKFGSEECVPRLGHYLSQYFRHLKALRGELHIKSYLLFREIGLITAQDIGIYVDGGPPEQTGACLKWQVWHDGMLVHLENKLEFIGNIFSLTVWE